MLLVDFLQLPQLVQKGSSYQYKVPAENLCQVHPYPNPVTIRSGEEKVTFDVPLETKVRIYTVAGDWVAEAKSGGIGKEWDLRNRSGNLVASGQDQSIRAACGSYPGAQAELRS